MPLHHQVDKWKVDIAKEIIEVKNEKLELQILSNKELDECTGSDHNIAFFIYIFFTSSY